MSHLVRGRRERLLGLLAVFLTLSVCREARTHEPLWGETPNVFGFGVIHPEFKFMFRDAGHTRRGGERTRMFEQEVMLDYAPSTALNLRVEAPFHSNLLEHRSGGALESSRIAGLGDLRLRAKRRFSVRQEEELNVQHSLIYGLKLPTGRNDHGSPDGGRAHPHDQAGTGKLGLVLGYAWDRETVEDTLWFSTVWRRDLGGGFRMGDMLEFSLAYGRWVLLPLESSQTGLNLAAGIYGEMHVTDRVELRNGPGFGNAGNGSGLLGLQFTPILTKGNHQLRVGVMVPVLRSGAQDHVDFAYELRMALETFF